MYASHGQSAASAAVLPTGKYALEQGKPQGSANLGLLSIGRAPRRGHSGRATRGLPKLEQTERVGKLCDGHVRRQDNKCGRENLYRSGRQYGGLAAHLGNRE